MNSYCETFDVCCRRRRFVMTSWKAFHPPAEGESLSLACSRESNQREEHPAWRFPAIHGWKVREAWPGFSTGLPALTKRSRHPCRLPLRALSSTPHRRTGAPKSGALRRAEATARSKATAKRKNKVQLQVASFCFSFCAQERAALPGPRLARRAGGGRAAGWPARCRPVFRQHMDVLSKNPIIRPRTRRAGCP